MLKGSTALECAVSGEEFKLPIKQKIIPVLNFLSHALPQGGCAVSATVSCYVLRPDAVTKAVGGAPATAKVALLSTLRNVALALLLPGFLIL